MNDVENVKGDIEDETAGDGISAMWFSVCTLIDNTCHHRGQNVVDSRGAL